MRSMTCVVLLALASPLLIACELGSIMSEGPEPLPRPEESIRIDGQARIVDMTGEETLRKYYRPYGVEFGINVPQYVFDANKDGRLDDLAGVEKKFKQRVPRGFTGVIALDWEHPVFEWIDGDPDSVQFQRAVGGFKQLLQLSRRWRPEADVGFFGLPKTPYWKRDAKWRERQLALVDLLRRCDWVGPKVYHPYKTGQMKSVDDDRQRKYIAESVDIGLEVAKAAGGKPVYVWITHRYSPGNKGHALEPVTDREFVETVRLIMETKREGRGAEGVIWWAGDDWYLKQGRMPPGERSSSRIERLHDHYFELLAGVMRPGGQ